MKFKQVAVVKQPNSYAMTFSLPGDLIIGCQNNERRKGETLLMVAPRRKNHWGGSQSTASGLEETKLAQALLTCSFQQRLQPMLARKITACRIGCVLRPYSPVSGVLCISPMQEHLSTITARSGR